MSLYNLIKKLFPLKGKKALHGFYLKNNLLNSITRIFRPNHISSDDLIKLWQLAESGTVDANKIYQRLSKLRRVNPTNYAFSALGIFRLNKVTTAYEIMEKGIMTFPKDESIRLYYLHVCSSRNDYARYAEFITKQPGADQGSEITLSDFYKKAISSGEMIGFIVNFSEIKRHCDAVDFALLKEFFLVALSQKPISLQNAKNILFLGRYLDIENEFYLMVYDRLKQSFQNLNENSQKSVYILKIIASLTLPSVPDHKAINSFIEACKQLAADPITLTEPINDILIDWAPWQYLFSLPAIAHPATYHRAIAAFEQFAFATWPGLNYISAHVTEKRQVQLQRNQKIRIGFAVHDSMPMMSGLLRKLDSTIFHTVFLRPGEAGSSKTAQDWIGSADEVVEYSPVDALSAIKTISSQNLDIIISGPSIVAIFFPMLARLAPLQMVLLEPNWTNGVTNADYYISWRPAEPVPSRDFYKTAVSYLEHPPYWIEKPRVNTNRNFSTKARNEIRKKLLNCTPEDHIYLCPNTPPKINPLMDDMFAKLLKADPDAKIVILRKDLLLCKTLRMRLQKKLMQDFNRCIFLPTLTKKDAHALLMSVDCCLDSFPQCGMSSSFDAILLGVPVITLPFNIPFGRWTAAIYDYIGVSGLTAQDQNEYIQLALRVANDVEWREQKAREIKEKASLYVESTVAFEEFQKFIIHAWERKLRDFSPANWIHGEWQESKTTPPLTESTGEAVH
ncbi:hypothetical protein B1207_04570 [Legionella quinlivanii]|uniref:O-GlcNAc transferase C-terminal domain-containing protein n=1 Tax=Legionella quinlivanii TaxID=45073 RepID=A0A364LL55_9GAMM|nr:hypothetical protein [Legionella quinlivanii]RAP37452.1 hypothetical protein B1207_04570 [Legionella quinlivanii]